jgi:hypothetical protein
LGRTAPAPPGLAEHPQRGYPAGSFGGRNRGREQRRAGSRVALRPAIRKSPIMMSFGSSLINRDTPNYPILWIFTGATLARPSSFGRFYRLKRKLVPTILRNKLYSNPWHVISKMVRRNVED